MNHRLVIVSMGALLSAAVVAALLLGGAIPLNFAVSDNHDGSEIDLRVQARQTESGRVEVRAQSNVGGEWTTHTPEARFLPIEPELGRWYSSNSFAVSAPAAAPDVSDEASYTQSFVAQAIAYYERHGREATIEHYNTSESVDGQWYMFIFDEQDVMLAHANPDLVGVPGVEINGPDGYPAGRMVLAVASAEGAWVDYQFTNLASGQAEIKHSWVVRHDGLVFGSGWYEDAPSKAHAPGAFTQSYVERALEMYRVLGREATLEYYSTPASADGQWYVFIHTAEGTRVAHAHRANRPGWLGSNVGVGGIDVTGYNYGQDMLTIEDRGWVAYVFVNPADEDQYQRKHSWIVAHDGLQFGSGWYDRHYDLAGADPAGYSKLLVQQAIDRYDAEGREAALDYYSSAESVDGEWYVIVIHPDGTRLAHPFLPLGENILDSGPDVTGYDFRPDIVAVEDRDWVSYVFENPDTGEQGRKHTWIVRHDGLLFAAGWYEAGTYEAPDS